MKEITLKEHLKKISLDGARARWKGKTAEEKKEHSTKMLNARWKKTRESIEKDSKKNIEVEGIKNMIKS